MAGPGLIRRQAAQATKSKPLSGRRSSMVSASVPASSFLTRVPALTFLHDISKQMPTATIFITAQSKQRNELMESHGVMLTIRRPEMAI